jgi:aryl-alcohol dehydrogenase-like predicted oxidoreductase
MNYRKLGNTGLMVSEVGFGTWQLGGISWASPDDEECLRLLAEAFANGVTVYDVSPSYGNGRTELLVGRAFRNCRDKVFYSAKAGVLEDGTYHGFWSRRQLVESLEQSLRRLQTDHVDFLALHAPPLDVLKSGYAFELLRRLKAEGKARTVGVSLEAQPEEALLSLERGIDVVQIRLNLLFPEAARILPVVQGKGAGLVVNSPFAHGYLSGRYRGYDDIPVSDYPKGPFRATKPPELVEGMIRNARAFEAVLGPEAPTLSRLALKYVLSHPAVNCVLPGMRSRAELHDCLAAGAAPPLSAGVLRQIREVYDTQIRRRPCP